MDSKKKFLVIGIIILSICAMACGKTPVDQAEAYGNIIAGLGDEEAYAFLVMDLTNNVLVTSDLIYDADGERQASVCCSVYYYTSGKTKESGSITGGETALPLRFSKSGIYAASDHGVEKYTVSGKDGLLRLDRGIYEDFDDSGNASYTMIKGDEKTASTEAAYADLMREYDNSQIIHFSYGAGGSVNELME